MDEQVLRRRKFLGWSLVLGLAWGAVELCEFLFHAGHVALLRLDVCRRNGAAADVLAVAMLVTTWKAFRARSKDEPIITVQELREHRDP